MGEFHNMLITDEFTAIHYDFLSGKPGALEKSRVMEFVKFKDYGGELGTRVVEGWGSTKDDKGDRLKRAFQKKKERAEQEELDNYIKNYIIPNSNDLKVKYIIKNPTEYIDDNAENILNIILSGFESWNSGITSYLEWVDNNYDSNAISSSLDENDRTMDEYKGNMTELFNKEKIEKLYFDNILIRDNWAGLHYRYRKKNQDNEVIDFGDRMEFLHFNNELKITGSWIQ